MTTCLGAAMLMVVLGSGPHDPPAPPVPSWFKGNTHTHTLWSDGDGAPEHVADWYLRHGYDFLVLSDHNILSRGERWVTVTSHGPLTPEHVEDLERRFGPGWVEVERHDGILEMRLKTLDEVARRLAPKGSLIFIEGEEITDHWHGHEVHVNGLNLDEVIPPQGGDSVVETIQRNIDAVIAQGRRLDRPVLAHLNHPNYRRSIGPRELAAIRGERYFEVYNGHRGTLTHGDDTTAGSEQLWDQALTIRMADHGLGLLYGLATDDAHNHHGTTHTSEPGRGWIFVRSAALDAESIINAMRAGDFYASTGVELNDFGRDGERLWINIAAEPGVEYVTEFVGTRVADAAVGPAGEVLATSTSLDPQYRMAGNELYVRARVTSSKPHPNPFAEGDHEMAWVQPVLGGAAGAFGLEEE